MLDHISLGVTNLIRMKAFYDAIFAPLGYQRLWDTPAPRAAPRSMPFTPPRSRTAAKTKGRPARGWRMAHAITQPSCATPMGTSSRRSITPPRLNLSQLPTG